MTPDEARAQYPVLERFAYLNAGTNGPLARATVDAMADHAERALRGGRGGRAYFDEFMALRAEVRERVAALLHAEPERVALLNSTTGGCNIVLAGLDLTPEDEVITTDSEHFGLIGPLHASRARVVVSAPDEDAILAAVGPRTRLIALSHVLWTTGKRLDVARLKRESGVLVLVDGAQSAGAIDVDATSVDFYTVSAQKWLCGPEGTGALFVGDPDALRVAAPTYFAQQSHEPDGSYVATAGAARFDAAHLPPGPLAGLRAALDTHPDWRFDAAAEAAGRCRARLGEVVEVATDPEQSTLVSFHADGDSAALVARLGERGVIVRDVPGRGLIRVSCGYWTNDDDFDRLLEALP